jgi:hypothetical protein
MRIVRNFLQRIFFLHRLHLLKKLESYLTKNHFLPAGSKIQDGNRVNVYRFLKPQKNKKKKDTLNINRAIETFRTKNNFSFTYITSLKKEFDESLLELKESGFFCGNERDSAGCYFKEKILQCRQASLRKLIMTRFIH